MKQKRLKKWSHILQINTLLIMRDTILTPHYKRRKALKTACF
jgi:hypothetical protein